LKFTVSQAKGRDVLGIKGLLLENHHPIDGVDECLEDFRVVREGGNPTGSVIGCGGLELYENIGLLRSVVVADGYREEGMGLRIVQTLMSLARRHRCMVVVVFTPEEAVGFFELFGFEEVDQESAWYCLPECFQESWVWEEHYDWVTMIRERV